MFRRSRTARQLRALLAYLPPERIQQLRRVVAFSLIPGIIDLASVAVIARLMGSLVGTDLEDRLPGVKVFGGDAIDQSLWLILIFVILSWIASFGKFGLQFLQQRLTAILDQHGLEYAIKWTLGARPFLTGRGPLADAATAAIKTVCGIDTELSTTGGTSDGRFIADICGQMLEIGPSNNTSHKIDECVDVAALPQLSAIYRHILEQILTP